MIYLSRITFSVPRTSLLGIIKYFFKGATPIYDDHGKTIGDIEKRFFAFNCRQKKLNGEIFVI